MEHTEALSSFFIMILGFSSYALINTEGLLCRFCPNLDSANITANNLIKIMSSESNLLNHKRQPTMRPEDFHLPLLKALRGTVNLKPAKSISLRPEWSCCHPYGSGNVKQVSPKTATGNKHRNKYPNLFDDLPDHGYSDNQDNNLYHQSLLNCGKHYRKSHKFL